MDIKLQLSALCEVMCTDKKLFGEIDFITTDSREIRPGCMFIALAGERFNGHDYITSALEQGAQCAVAQARGAYPEEKVLYVGSTESALRRSAALYRSNLKAKILAVTGSVGKTTTRDMAAAVLAAKYDTIKTQGNLNNQIGLPQTVLGIEGRHEVAVLEMGMSGFGEIEELSLCAAPDAAIITNIGVSHIELLGSRDGIFRAKTEIVRGLKPGAPLILNGDDDLLCTFRAEGHPVVLFGTQNQDCDVRAEEIRQEESGTRFTIRWRERAYPAYIPAFGEHNVRDALAGFASGVLLGVEPEAAAGALAGYEATGMRQRIVAVAGFTVVEDCYNASPDSFTAALHTLSQRECAGRRVLIAADMLELGHYSEQAHRAVGALAGELHIDTVLAYGERGADIVEEARRHGVQDARWFADKGALGAAAARLARPGDVLWFKASRGMRLEEIIQAVYAAHGKGGPE